jgi:hypothetical protein
MEHTFSQRLLLGLLIPILSIFSITHAGNMPGITPRSNPTSNVTDYSTMRIEFPSIEQANATYNRLPLSKTVKGKLSYTRLEVLVKKIYFQEKDHDIKHITSEIMSILELAHKYYEKNADETSVQKHFMQKSINLTLKYGTNWQIIIKDPNFEVRSRPVISQPSQPSAGITPKSGISPEKKAYFDSLALDQINIEIKSAFERFRYANINYEKAPTPENKNQQTMAEMELKYLTDLGFNKAAPAQEAPKPEQRRKNLSELQYQKAPNSRQPVESPLIIQQPIQAQNKNIADFQQEWSPFILDLMKNEGFEYFPMVQGKYIYFTSSRAKQSEYRLPDYVNAISLNKHEADKIAKALVQTYKIHLMPSEDSDYTLLQKTIVNALRNNPMLSRLIPVFKIAPVTISSKTGEVFPRVVFYIETGRDDAQQALNILYDLFKNTKGSGIRPRYNAKVNDLIWIAQGDGDYKAHQQYERFYQLPLKAYYRGNLTGINQNYHLRHPMTGQELIN